MKESKHFIIEHNNEEYIDELITKIEQRVDEIISFFEIKELKNKITIKLIKGKENFDNLFYEYHKFRTNLYGVGFATENEIVYLSYDSFNETKHSDKDFNFYIDILVHEITHIIHKTFSNNMSLRYLNEGIASLFGRQYTLSFHKNLLRIDYESLINEKESNYINFYMIVKYLYKKDKKYLLKLLKDKDYAIKETKNILNKIENE